jgi:hypothetical protein
VTVASIILGICAYIFQRSVANQAKREVRHVLEDMDRIYEPHALPGEKHGEAKS